MLLYIHIPFCDSKCSYCAFNSYTTLHSLRPDYMLALVRQLREDLQYFEVKSISSIFIGGGTPSTVPAHLYKPIFDMLTPFLHDDIEITTEANPNSASRQWLQGMFELGVNRISFGVQSFDEEKLRFLNRAHTKDDAIRAITDAKEIGFNNISMDLIYATVLDSQELLASDVEQAFKLPINHLSAYALTIEEGTPFEKTPKVAKESEVLTSWLFEEIQKRGFAQYEISNFGAYQSRHNLGYWKHQEYLGIGAGAVGYIQRTRLYPHEDIQKYIQDPLFKEKELLSEDDIKTEKVLLGLRSIIGFDPNILSQNEQKNAEILVREKKLFKNGDTLFNPNYLLADELSLFILS